MDKSLVQLVCSSIRYLFQIFAKWSLNSWYLQCVPPFTYSPLQSFLHSAAERSAGGGKLKTERAPSVCFLGCCHGLCSLKKWLMPVNGNWLRMNAARCSCVSEVIRVGAGVRMLCMYAREWIPNECINVSVVTWQSTAAAHWLVVHLLLLLTQRYGRYTMISAYKAHCYFVLPQWNTK